MGLGRDNVIVLKLTAQAQVATSGAEADVVGPHAILDQPAQLFAIRCSAKVAANTAAAGIIVYYGTTKSGTAVCSSMDIKNATGAATFENADGTIVDENIQYAAGSEFCMSENCTNAKTLDGLECDLYFRQIGQET